MKYNFLARRLISGLGTLWLVSVITFLAAQLLPGNAAVALLGKAANPTSIRILDAQLNLNRPITVQYLLWLKGILSGNPGKSFITQQPLWQMVGPAAANSLMIVGIAVIIGIPLSIFLGASTAIRYNSSYDRAVNSGLLLGAAMPQFILGQLLVVVFATSVFHILPAVTEIPTGGLAWSRPQSLILPVVTLLASIVPYLTRIMRGTMRQVWRSDYIEAAVLRGVSLRRITFRHALPNALPPVIQASASAIAFMLGGLALVESVFNYPGLGTALVSAVEGRDIPTIEFITLLIAGAYVLLNILADAATMTFSTHGRWS